MVGYKPGPWKKLVVDWKLKVSWRTLTRSRNEKGSFSTPFLYTVHREIDGDHLS